MSLRVVQHGPEHAPVVSAFRERMAAGGANVALLPSPQPPVSGLKQLRYERFLILDQNGEMRGGWLFQRQPVWAAGQCRDIVNLQAPISEGIVNRRFIGVAPWMFRYLAAHQPLIFAVGMGGTGTALARLLASLGWRVRETPFLFRVRNARHFLGNIAPLRPGTRLHPLATLASATRLAGLIHVAQWRPPVWRRLTAHPVTSWEEWADTIWNAAASEFSFAAVRDSSTLDSFYPPDSRCLRFRLGERAWVILQVTGMHNDSYFGNMRVGTIVDILACPGWERAAASAAVGLLADENVDLLLTNQMHPAWTAAFRAVGFWQGPSNYVFAESPQLAVINTGNSHLTRGDGDGRFHL